jgi:hypothetical protein
MMLQFFLFFYYYYFFIPLNAAKDIKKWWIWGYWISPLMYEQNAIVVNEFFGRSWSKVNSLTEQFVSFSFGLSFDVSSQIHI